MADSAMHSNKEETSGMHAQAHTTSMLREEGVGSEQSANGRFLMSCGLPHDFIWMLTFF